MGIESVRSRSHSMEKSLWKRLWTSRQMDNVLKCLVRAWPFCKQITRATSNSSSCQLCPHRRDVLRNV